MTNNLLAPIRIVPLGPPVGAMVPAPAAAQLTYRGGPLIQNIKVVCVFWGSTWQNSPASDTAAQIAEFFQYIVTSPLIDQLGEYSTSGYTIGQGQFVSSTVIASPEPSSTVDDSDIQTLLQDQIASNVLPAPDENTLYFVFTPSGTTVTQQGSASCQQFCGYHDQINRQIFYAVQPYPDCTGCTGKIAEIDAITSTASHEFSEAITDPIPGEGWYDDSNGEIGDICAWKTKMLDRWTVQLEWSNEANACI